MKNIIIGNGIDIQFGGADYTNKNIIERALLNLKNKNFSEEVYTKEIETWIYTLHSIIPEILNNEYDQLAVFDYEKSELESFKNNYSTNSEISDIGFEDYFLLNELHCRKYRIKNPERFYFQEFLRRLFLDSIYNDGKINEIHKSFPNHIVEYLKSFKNIFTTNYDRNIETVINNKVLYLHGAFHILSQTYDPNSLRNKLSDRPFEKYPVIKGYEHTFSTAITGSSGNFKEFSATQSELANSGFEKFVNGYKEDPEIKEKIEAFKNSDDTLIRNIYEVIQLKLNKPDLKFSIDYAINELKKVQGEITFLGLSPNNDSHIFKIIKDNPSIESIIFYYFQESEQHLICSFFDNKKVKTKSVKKFWSNNASA
ncbi:hypothetical protein [uncultured Christiangramia sp.]|uniref:hypothetical protein n=1 Tax=uncultured Christiangramia sp. TaxID=503836 RepID=UPI0026096567|nr:hypothetical protein [uncultured Christiangramia sp.]